MEKQADKPVEQAISAAEAVYPETPSYIKELGHDHSLDYHYIESEERLNKAFDLLFKEVNKMIEAGK